MNVNVGRGRDVYTGSGRMCRVRLYGEGMWVVTGVDDGLKGVNRE